MRHSLLSASFLLGLGLALTGCKTGTIELDDGAEDGGDTGSTAGDDGGADTGTDGGGSDGGGDDTGTDEPAPVVRDGAYQGDFEITGTVPDFGGDTCVGTVAFDVAEDANPEISGIANCEFQGSLSWFGPQELELSGAATGDTDAAGDVYYSLEGTVFEAEWTGGYDGEGEGSTLAGTFDGSTLVDLYGYEVEIYFEGGFVAARD